MPSLSLLYIVHIPIRIFDWKGASLVGEDIEWAEMPWIIVYLTCREKHRNTTKNNCKCVKIYILLSIIAGNNL